MLVACVAALLSCAGPPSLISDPLALLKVEKKPAVAYYTGPGRDLLAHTLDVYKPLGGLTNCPVVVFVHGGDWRVGDKATDQNIGTTLAQHGIVCVSINYRLVPWANYTGQALDVARAFDWVKKNIAAYGGNPADIFLCGHSAGGHLVSLVALDEEYLAQLGDSTQEIRGVISLSGVYRVGFIGPFYTGVFNAGQVEDASPINHVKDHEPPFLLFHADADIPTLGNQAQDFCDKLRANHNAAQMVRVDLRSHTTSLWFIGTPGDRATDEILKFIHQYSRSGAGVPAKKPKGSQPLSTD